MLYANHANCLNLLTVFIIIVSVNHLSINHEKNTVLASTEAYTII